MDRHDVSENVTAENVAQLHQADLKIQHKFNCRGLTYWFDEQRKTAFCLVEAPDMNTVQEMHNHAHGVVSHQIIEVDVNIVESFLGRIEDPEKSQNTDLNIINDPAFRAVMVISMTNDSLIGHDRAEVDLFLKSCHASFIHIAQHHKGRVVKSNKEYYLISFKSVTKSVLCAIDIQQKFKELIEKMPPTHILLNIGISGGVPVTEKEAIFEDTIKSAERMCRIKKENIVVSAEIKALYESENLNESFQNELVFSLSPTEEIFLFRLFEFTEKNWNNADLKVSEFCKQLGLSKSKLYRKMITLNDKSPSGFLKEYRLSKAFEQLGKRTNTISEIAFDNGFGSPSYFTKCFQKKYGCLPSAYQS